MTTLLILTLALAGCAGSLAWLAVLVLRDAEAERVALHAQGKRCGLSPRT